jgi:hypothetical protein
MDVVQVLEANQSGLARHVEEFQQTAALLQVRLVGMEQLNH